MFKIFKKNKKKDKDINQSKSLLDDEMSFDLGNKSASSNNLARVQSDQNINQASNEMAQQKRSSRMETSSQQAKNRDSNHHERVSNRSKGARNSDINKMQNENAARVAQQTINQLNMQKNTQQSLQNNLFSGIPQAKTGSKPLQVKSTAAKALLEKYSSSLPTFQQIPLNSSKTGGNQGKFKQLNEEYKAVCSSDKELARLFNKSTKDVIKKRENEKKKEEIIKQQQIKKQDQAKDNDQDKHETLYKHLSKEDIEKLKLNKETMKHLQKENILKDFSVKDRKSKRRGRAATQSENNEDKNRPQSANPRINDKKKNQNQKDNMKAKENMQNKLTQIQNQQQLDRQAILQYKIREEHDYLNMAKIPKKKKTKAQKYLAEARRDLDLSSKKLTSQLSIRIKQQQLIRSNINQKNGLDLDGLINKDIQLNGPAQQRLNRFQDNNISQGPRSLSQDMSKEGLKKYKQVTDKIIKRERSSLSHTRYNKMKQLILREVSDAIQEAEHEPTASIADFNQLQSVIMQHEDESRFFDFEDHENFVRQQSIYVDPKVNTSKTEDNDQLNSQSVVLTAKRAKKMMNVIDLDDINDDEDSDGQPDLLLDDPDEFDLYEELDYDMGQFYRKQNKSQDEEELTIYL